MKHKTWLCVKPPGLFFGVFGWLCELFFFVRASILFALETGRMCIECQVG